MPTRSPRDLVVVVLVLPMMALLASGGAVVMASEASSWSAPIVVDPQPYAGIARPELLTAVSCPSSSLCIAVGRHGAFESRDVDTTNRPWSPIAGSPAVMSEVRCPTASLCVATRHLDTLQEVVAFDPSAARPTYRSVHIPLGRFDCTSGLCVGSDGSSGFYLSTDPSALSPSWQHQRDIYESPDGSGLASLSCPSTSLCIGVDGKGQFIVSTDPTASTPHWRITAAPGPYLHDSVVGPYLLLHQVSCASTAFCMGMDESGRDFTSTNPGAAHPTWTVHSAPRFVDHLTCPSTHLCVGNIGAGIVVVNNAPTAARPVWSQSTLPDQVPSDPVDRYPTTLTCIADSTTCLMAAEGGDVFVGKEL
jgi:hypothetical protein